jgi:hypothetical protein
MAAPASLPLFAWGAANQRPRRCPARLFLRADLRDAEGEPRACIATPGEPLRAFPSLPAALAALRAMEARHNGR